MCGLLLRLMRLQGSPLLLNGWLLAVRDRSRRVDGSAVGVVTVVLVIEDDTWVALCHLLPLAGDVPCLLTLLHPPPACSHAVRGSCAYSVVSTCLSGLWVLGACVLRGKGSGCAVGGSVARGQLALLCRSGGRCILLTGAGMSTGHISVLQANPTRVFRRCTGRVCSPRNSNHLEYGAAGCSTWLCAPREMLSGGAGWAGSQLACLILQWGSKRVCLPCMVGNGAKREQ